MNNKDSYDAVIIGSGPNGLAAAIKLAQENLSVLVIEASDSIGGGTRNAELTLPGFNHDVCSAVHPMGYLSPYFSQLPLSEHGLEWIHPPISVAHPLDNKDAVFLEKSIEKTAEQLGSDAKKWQRLISPFLKNPKTLMTDLMGPLSIPTDPFTMARFGFYGIRSAKGMAKLFKDDKARALFAGCAAHSILPLAKMPSAAIGLIFSITGHLVEWPVAKGGSSAITNALASYFKSLGGTIETNRPIKSLAEFPEKSKIIFDTSPNQLIEVAGNNLPANYLNRLSKFRYGPATFKMDWALSEKIPWANERCKLASTVHIGGKFEEIEISEAASSNGKIPEKPYLIVCQQSNFDDTRAPAGKHTGYAYCHVPNGCDVDMTNRIENQIARFAPGFKDTILKRHKFTPVNFENYNSNYVGGAITGGSSDLGQLFTRPVFRLNPYTTPNPRIFICSASTPPGGGVHGMCGYYAAKAVLKNLS